MALEILGFLKANAIKEMGKSAIKKAFFTTVKKEVVKITESDDAHEIGELVTEVHTAVSKKKAGGWVAVAIALSYFASSQGWISPEIADLVNAILSNPEAVEAIEGVVE